MTASLTYAVGGGTLGMELNNSMPKADTRPRQIGGFFVSIMFRGRRAHVQGFGLKARRLDLWRVVNPRGTSCITTPVAPVTMTKGAIRMTPDIDQKLAEIEAAVADLRREMARQRQIERVIPMIFKRCGVYPAKVIPFPTRSKER